MRSPTAGNMMLYSIIEIEDQNTKEKLVKSCDNQPFIAKAPLVLLFLADYQRWMDYFAVCDIKSYSKSENLPNRTYAISLYCWRRDNPPNEFRKGPYSSWL